VQGGGNRGSSTFNGLGTPAKNVGGPRLLGLSKVWQGGGGRSKDHWAGEKIAKANETGDKNKKTSVISTEVSRTRKEVLSVKKMGQIKASGGKTVSA